jgi:hypothetical protein
MKKDFTFFGPFPAYLQSKLEKFLKKIKKVSKNAEFHADFESVEKVFNGFENQREIYFFKKI